MRGMECSLFLEHLISLLFGSFHDFTHSIIIYIHSIISQFYDYVYGLMTGLFSWIILLYYICVVNIHHPSKYVQFCFAGARSNVWRVQFHFLFVFNRPDRLPYAKLTTGARLTILILHTFHGVYIFPGVCSIVGVTATCSDNMDLRIMTYWTPMTNPHGKQHNVYYWPDIILIT